jgi:hypothetical protein
MSLEWTTDLIIFASIAGVSVTFLLVSLLLGELFELGDSFFDADDGPFFTNSSAIFAFFTAFGATGWVASGQFEMSGLPASGVAIVGGLAVGMPIGFLLRVFKKNQGATNYSINDTIGQTGVVALAIPAGGAGRVEVQLPGRGNAILMAREAGGGSVGQGALVTVDRIVASVAYVSESGGEAK